jgi:hypothetical protein
MGGERSKSACRIAAEAHLEDLLRDLERGARACDPSASPFSTLLFILSSTEFLSLYYDGSRRPAGAHGSRAFQAFLTRYFPRLNEAARNPEGQYRRVCIPLLREGGKASKRLRLPAAIVHLFHRGVLEDLVAPQSSPDAPCLTLQIGRWGFQVQTGLLLRDFLDTLQSFREDVRKDLMVSHRFLRRFNHLHG